MDKFKVKQIKPQQRFVLANIDVSDKGGNGKVALGKSNQFTSKRTGANKYSIDHYVGQVLEVGPECKELEVGDFVVFNQFAGTRMPLSEKKIVELIDEASIVMKAKTEDLKNGQALSDKILVKLKKNKVEKTKGGLDIPMQDDVKPEERATEYGEIVSLGQNLSEYSVGDKIAWPYGTGDLIELLETEDYEFKVVNYTGVLCKIE